MSTATAASRDAPRGRRFHFDGVLVDEASARLFVDGRERICSQRAMRLIVVMCEAQGQVLHQGFRAADRGALCETRGDKRNMLDG